LTGGGLTQFPAVNQLTKHIDFYLVRQPITNTIEPGYNDTGLYGTSPVESDILWYQFVRQR
jgi:hypothetical protein